MNNIQVHGLQVHTPAKYLLMIYSYIELQYIGRPTYLVWYYFYKLISMLLGALQVDISLYYKVSGAVLL